MKLASRVEESAASAPLPRQRQDLAVPAKHLAKLSLAFLCTCALAGMTTAARADYAAQTLATGLNNPRGIAIGSDGSLYITEAGSPVSPDSGAPTFVTSQGTEYFNNSGLIAKYSNGSVSTVLSGLPSLFNVNSGDVTGAQGIGFSGGDLYYTIGLGADPALRTNSPTSGMGFLYRVPSNSGTPESFADISAFEGLHNPAGGPVDSNPYQLLSTATGILVADAGGNDVLNVSSTGDVSLVATLPPAPAGAEPVPTGLTSDMFGNIYVSELTGFPFPVGGSTVYRLDDSTPTAVGTGFTNVVDLAAGPNGDLFLLEFAEHGLLSGDPTGALWELNPTTGVKTLITDQGLTVPTGLAIGADGTIYVENQGAIPGQGELVAFRPIPEPATYGLLGAFGLAALALVRRRARRVKA